MADKKLKKQKIKETKCRSEEQTELIRFIKILFIVILFVVLVYFATRIFVKKDLGKDAEETNVTEVSYSKMVFGTMLNRPQDEYYVLAYSSEDNKANYYNALASTYSNKEDGLYVYYIDLKDSMNKNYLATNGQTNSKAKKISELKVGELTLIKVKNGEIVKYIEDIEGIKAEFNME